MTRPGPLGRWRAPSSSSTSSSSTMGRGGIRRSGISAPGPSSDSWITKHRQLNPGVYESGASPVRRSDDIGRAIERAARDHANAMLVGRGAVALHNARQIADLAVRYRLPTIFPSREFVELGGLMSYGVNYAELYHRAATFVDKIFKGAKPGDLPVEEPTNFELVINLKTAKALGLKIPQSLLARADEIIQ